MSKYSCHECGLAAEYFCRCLEGSPKVCEVHRHLHRGHSLHSLYKKLLPNELDQIHRYELIYSQVYHDSIQNALDNINQAVQLLLEEIKRHQDQSIEILREFSLAHFQQNHLLNELKVCGWNELDYGIQSPTNFNEWLIEQVSSKNLQESLKAQNWRNEAKKLTHSWNSESAISLLKKSCEIYRKIPDKKEYAGALVELAERLSENQELNEAMKTYHEAISLYQTLKLPDKQAAALNDLAMLYERAKDYESTRKTYEKIIVLAEKQPLDIDLASIYLRMGKSILCIIKVFPSTFSKAGRLIWPNFVRIAKHLLPVPSPIRMLQKAFVTFENAIDLLSTGGRDKDLAICLYHLARVAALQDKRDLALQQFEMAIDVGRVAGLEVDLALALFYYAQFKIGLGEYHHAKSLLQETIDILQNTQLKDELALTLRLMLYVLDYSKDTKEKTKYQQLLNELI